MLYPTIDFCSQNASLSHTVLLPDPLNATAGGGKKQMEMLITSSLSSAQVLENVLFSTGVVSRQGLELSSSRYIYTKYRYTLRSSKLFFWHATVTHLGVPLGCHGDPQSGLQMLMQNMLSPLGGD